MSFYSPIDRLAQNLPRPKGTGSEFMTELSKMPGYKTQEAEDRGLQALVNLPKMERADFIAKLKAHRGPPVEENTFAKSILRNPGLNVVPNEDPHHEQWTLPGGTNYREIFLKHGDPKEEFPGEPAHFGGEPNILASIRAKDRVGPNGEKILHLEELQSDWHQQGREKGYNDPKEVNGWKVVSVDPDDPNEISVVDKNGKEVWSGLNKFGTDRQVINKIASQMLVPDAPFKKSWHEMALKKMIHHAAANGYDSIAITPGQEQADRYGLEKHISNMAYHPEIKRFHAVDKRGETVLRENDVGPDRIENLIGKETAKKLLSTNLDRHGFHVLAGDDIKVGGEGMKGFYDKIVPNFLNQFGKKYGAKVAMNGYKLVTKEKSGQPTYNFRGEPSGEAVYPEESTQLHHFPITPEMREDVTKNGVPLYADGGPVPPLRPLNPQLAAMREQMAQQSALHKAYDEAMKNVYTNQMPTFAQWVASQGKAKGGKVSREMHDANLAKYLTGSHIKHRMYHGTHADFGTFDTNKQAHLGEGSWFSSTPSSTYAHNEGANIMPVHLALKNPKYMEAPVGRFNKTDLIKQGYDGVAITGENGIMSAVAFHPHQIKSAIGNRGTYNPKDPDITKAKGGAVKPVGYTKEQVTVSPSLDAMRYELESVKHYTKKVK